MALKANRPEVFGTVEELARAWPEHHSTVTLELTEADLEPVVAG